MSSFSSLGVWIWFILGLVLLVFEVAAPGVFMLWLGLAAIATGLVALVVTMPWQWEIAVFAGFSLVALIGWLKLAKKASEAPADNPFLNRRAASYVGREFKLEDAIVHGVGRVRIDDSVWRLTGPDVPAGSRVRVAAADGPMLRVEPVVE